MSKGVSRRWFLGSSAAAAPAAVLPLALGDKADGAIGAVATMSPEELAKLPPAPVPTTPTTVEAMRKNGVVAAKVSNRLLQKASRLFTGDLDSRVAELVQNARRAGATELRLTVVEVEDGEGETKYQTTLEDNGHGIEDFGQLIALGHSGWGDDIEAAEDPAGAGFFSLAPRDVLAASRGAQIQLTQSGWLGMPVKVEPSEYEGTGLLVQFIDDEDWSHAFEKHIAFSGLQGYVNDDKMAKNSFLSSQATHVPALGLRFEFVRDFGSSRDAAHYVMRRHWSNNNNTLLNFHGQVLELSGLRPDILNHLNLKVLIEMTGEPTDIRLQLPDRRNIVENASSKELVKILKQASYQQLIGLTQHKLPYSQWAAAKQLGIDIPESVEVYETGAASWEHQKRGWCLNLHGKLPMLRVKSANGALAKQVDILASLEPEDWKHRPVTIGEQYIGYQWAKDIPFVTDCEITVAGGDPLARRDARDGDSTVEVWEAISVKLTLSDETELVFDDLPFFLEDSGTALITQQALQDNEHEELMYYALGGESYNSDVSLDKFQEELTALRNDLLGPHEHARYKFAKKVKSFFESLKGDNKKRAYKSIACDVDGNVTVTWADGSATVYDKPQG